MRVWLVVSEGADAPEDNKKPPRNGRGAHREGGTSMIMDIIGILVSLPASMVAAVTLYRMVRPGSGRHRKDRRD